MESPAASPRLSSQVSPCDPKCDGQTELSRAGSGQECEVSVRYQTEAERAAEHTDREARTGALGDPYLAPLRLGERFLFLGALLARARLLAPFGASFAAGA